MSNESKRHQGRVCCIPGCKNTQKKNRELKFYVFPSRPWEVESEKNGLYLYVEKSKSSTSFSFYRVSIILI
jgi:hypothetical protein